MSKPRRACTSCRADSTARASAGLQGWSALRCAIAPRVCGFMSARSAPSSQSGATRGHAKSNGATPAGVAAAVAAAREGKSVALVEPLELAGGMMSGGLSFSDSNQTARETLGGLFEELHLRIEKHYADRSVSLPYAVRVKDNAP